MPRYRVSGTLHYLVDDVQEVEASTVAEAEAAALKAWYERNIPDEHGNNVQPERVVLDWLEPIEE